MLNMAVPFSNAQLWQIRRWEASAGIGISQFFGDVGGYSITKNILGFRDISYLQTRFNVNGNIKYRITRDINVRFSLTGGMLHATDVRGSNERRGFEAKMTVFEPALMGEYYFIKSAMENSYRFLTGKRKIMNDFFAALDIYAFTGIGGLNYSVKGNNLLAARGLQNKGFSAVIPIGIGTTLSLFTKS